MEQKVNHNYIPPAGGNGICRYYRGAKSRYFDHKIGIMLEADVPVCLNNSECSPCLCSGNPLKCDFYLKKEGMARKMRTPDMWNAAQKDGKWYVAADVLYNKDHGFVARDDLKPWFNEKEGFGLYDVDEFMQVEWEEYRNVMSKAKAEEKFNIKIIG